MKTIKHMMVAVMTLMMIGSCNSIHEFPDDNPIDPTLVNVAVNFTTNDLEFDQQFFTRSDVTSLKNSCDVRYVVEIYPEDAVTKGAESLVQRLVVTKAMDETTPMNIDLQLNARKYTLLFWIDCVDKGSAVDLHYDTENLLQVRIKRPYTGSHDLKDAFTGMKSIDLTPYRNEWNITVEEKVELKRPLAKMEVVTTDIQKYIDSKRGLSAAVSMPEKVVFTYLPSIGEQYNVLTQKPERYSDSETFTATLSNFSDTECTIAFDYLFVNGASTNVAVQFDIYDKNDNLLNSVKNVLIPIRRNAHSIIKGEFLTKEFQGGGVGIEDGFDGEIIITIPD